jgi:hypothetical protein
VKSLLILTSRRYTVLISQPIIPIKTYRFYFAIDRAVRLPDFPGSAWRGAFGHALKKPYASCATLRVTSAYWKSLRLQRRVWNSAAANAEKMRKYTAAPHPFVLQFPVTASTPDPI